MPAIGGSGAHHRGSGAHHRGSGAHDTGGRPMIGALPQVEEALETFMVAMSSAESFIVTSLARFGPGAYARPLFSST